MSRSCMCFGLGKRGTKSNEDKDSKKEDSPGGSRMNTESSNQPSAQQNKAIAFTYEQLVAATDHFKDTNFLGEGGFGSVYKGKLEDTGQVISVKQLIRKRFQGYREFLGEVNKLSNMRHPNLIQLIGYCAERGHRLLVYEYPPLGSLADHLHGLKPDRKILDWNTRMKIAAGAAKGLEHLHNVVIPPVIHGDIKAANLLLDEDFHPKLSDLVTGIPGYGSPEYISTARVTKQSDMYSFGVVLLELITGRPANESSGGERLLVDWVRNRMKDRQDIGISEFADPLLKGQFSQPMLRRAVNVSYSCIQKNPTTRPLIRQVVLILDDLVAHPYVPNRTEASSSGQKNKESTLDDAIDRDK